MVTRSDMPLSLWNAYAARASTRCRAWIIAGAFLALRLASRLLVGVGPADPSTYILTAVLQTAVALGACALPAMRAMRADPMKALREE